MLEAGYAPGLFSVVHGDRATVEALIDHPDVRAVGFVGSTAAARAVYARATGLGKRALCLGGAKNHLIVAPDADEALTVRGVVDSFTGCAGQRCMAGSVLVVVGARGAVRRPGRAAQPRRSQLGHRHGRAHRRRRARPARARGRAGRGRRRGGPARRSRREPRRPGTRAGTGSGRRVLDRVAAGHAVRDGRALRPGPLGRARRQPRRSPRARARRARTATRPASSRRAARSPATSPSAPRAA